eukprot:c17386_g1_i1 orf=18-230(+)
MSHLIGVARLHALSHTFLPTLLPTRYPTPHPPSTLCRSPTSPMLFWMVLHYAIGNVIGVFPFGRLFFSSG